ncbi:MAG: type I-U CRISPR-associated RAMP protein Csb1/Cas7u [Planctomycetaceae bacterium]
MSESQNFDYTEFDKLLASDGPVMIVGQQFQKLAAISSDEIVFPPSYANPSEKPGDPPVYNIDEIDPCDPSKNVCVLDSIPSQANRMEPLFGLPAYSSLVPQYAVKLLDDVPPVSILNVGHRLADAVFRGTTLRDAIVAAFKEYAKGNATPIAKLGATSLVFGVWDSRGTGIKVPRLISSIVRAFNVTQLKRSAQYSPPIKYEQEGLLPSGLEGKPADHGLADVPSTHKIGGIQVNGDIRRDFSLNLSVLRALKGASDDETVKLQRYVLGLALIALTATPEPNLRQGCQLLPKGKPTWKQFLATGDESDWVHASLNIAGFAAAAADDFGVAQPVNQPLVFDKTLLKSSIEADAKKKAAKKAESSGHSIENLQKLVNDLEPVKGDKLSEAKTKPLAKLQDAVAAIETDTTATDELKAVAAGLKPLLIADAGAAARKTQMLALFTVAAHDQSAEAPAEATEEAAQ